MNMELHVPPGRLERRIRLLLRAYPPGYRAGRGEEMLGTLLEATPDGRDWPSARDSWSLLAGGTRARRARNRQLGPATSLRQAVVLGLALYVSWLSAQLLQIFLSDPLTRAHGTPVLAAFLLAATGLAVWAGQRTLLITAVAAGLAVLAYYWYSCLTVPVVHPLSPRWMAYVLTSAVPVLLVMLALVHLTRRDGRPPRSWLILVTMPLLAMLATRVLPAAFRPSPVPDALWNLLPDILVLLAIPALAWLATDARPALGVALAVVMSQVLIVAAPVQAYIFGQQPSTDVWQWDSTDVENLALAVVIAGAVAWMLGRRTRPYPR